MNTISEVLSKNVARAAVVLMAVVMAGYLAARAVEFLVTFAAEAFLAAIGRPEIVIHGREIYLDYVIDAVLGLAIAGIIVMLVLRSRSNLGADRSAHADQPLHACPYCLSKIPVAATRCSFCTADVSPAGV